MPCFSAFKAWLVVKAGTATWVAHLTIGWWRAYTCNCSTMLKRGSVISTVNAEGENLWARMINRHKSKASCKRLRKNLALVTNR
jgi:hypothetical protein